MRSLSGGRGGQVEESEGSDDPIFVKVGGVQVDA